MSLKASTDYMRMEVADAAGVAMLVRFVRLLRGDRQSFVGAVETGQAIEAQLLRGKTMRRLASVVVMLLVTTSLETAAWSPRCCSTRKAGMCL